MKRVATVNDLSGVGRCSLTASIPVLSALGVQACPVPTAVLTAQTGFPTYTLHDTDGLFDRYAEDWTALGLRFDGICTGFLAGTHQVEKVLRFVDAFRTPQTLLLVDPVMGDDGALYGPYDEEFCNAMRSLVARADVITPNLTEACLLTDTDYSELLSHSEEATYMEKVLSVAEKLRAYGPRCVIVTGVHSAGYVCNVVSEEGQSHILSSVSIAGARYSGTGDLFASVVCGGAMRGWSYRRGAELATRFLEQAIARTAEARGDRRHGVEFEPCLHMLTEASQNENKSTVV